MTPTMMTEVAQALCEAVDGVDWDAARVQACVERLGEAAVEASPQLRAEALALLAARVRRASVDDADGVAYVALCGGTLIEAGAPPRKLAEALLAKLPEVLLAARRFADACLPPLRALADPWKDVEEADVLAEVDGLPITRAVLRAHLPADRPGACALARLTEWVLPAVAALTRDRELLARAAAEPALVAAAAALRRSSAIWLHKLLAVQLEATWRVVLLEPARVFELSVDGVTSNFELQELVELALRSAGVPTLGRGDDGLVRGSFELRTAAALPSLGQPIPAEHLVWREGVPTDVPVAQGLRTLVAVAPSVASTWRSGQTFSALSPRIALLRELSAQEVAALLRSLSTPSTPTVV